MTKRTGVWTKPNQASGRRWIGIFDLRDNLSVGDEFPVEHDTFVVESIDTVEDPERPGQTIREVTGILKK